MLFQFHNSLFQKKKTGGLYYFRQNETLVGAGKSAKRRFDIFFIWVRTLDLTMFDLFFILGEH